MGIEVETREYIKEIKQVWRMRIVGSSDAILIGCFGLCSDLKVATIQSFRPWVIDVTKLYLGV